LQDIKQNIKKLNFPKMPKILVIGGGSWGTALSDMLARKSYNVTLWVHEKELCGALIKTGKNKFCFPDIKLHRGIMFTNSLVEAVNGKDIIISAVPSQYVGRVFEKCSKHICENTIIVSASKGIDVRSRFTSSRLINKVTDWKYRTAVLSGPTFAKDVINKQPTSAVIAAKDARISRYLKKIFSSDIFYIHESRDIIGVEICATLKNVMAIAAGISDGVGFGPNAKVALIHRSIDEIVQFALACGGRRETFDSIAGIADLFLTCMGGLSRNRRVGIELGKGKKIEKILKNMDMVAEGVETAPVVVGMAKDLRIKMPVAEMVVEVLNHSIKPKKAIRFLFCQKTPKQAKHNMPIDVCEEKKLQLT